MKKKTIGIIGYGFVGKAVAQLADVYEVNIYDPYVKEYSGVADADAAYLSDIVFVCVPTPTKEGGNLDMEIVQGCVRNWAWYNLRGKQGGPNPDSILVIKSTIEPGTVKWLSEAYGSSRVVHNPEFLTQRTAMEDFRNPVEVIVGGEDPDISMEVVNMYKGYYPMGDGEPKYYVVESQMAELIKVARNSFYAMKVSYFNEVFELCNEMGINYVDFRRVFTLDGEHPWVAKQHTQVPGPDGKVGFGGACLPKDSEGLVELADHFGVDMATLRGAVDSNKRRRNNEIE